jgi:hypothetical protein
MPGYDRHRSSQDLDMHTSTIESRRSTRTVLDGRANLGMRQSLGADARFERAAREPACCVRVELLGHE